MAEQRKSGSSAKKPSGAATATKKPSSAAKKRKKKKTPIGKTILIILMMVLVAISTVFIVYVGKYLYAHYQQATGDKDGKDVPITSYDTTPVSDRDKVGYYILGLLGEDASADTMEQLSLLCWDKQAGTVNVLQLPQATYLGKDGAFAVQTAGDVWANPKPYDWCETCRKRLYAPEIGEEGKHTECGTKVTQKTGSSTINLIEVFNDQYSLPVDGYFVLEQQTLVKLVDLVNGIDIKLDAALKVGDTTYAAGVRTLDGEAALQYVTTYEKTVNGDIGRFGRLQQVYVAVFQRLFALSESALTSDVIGPLMSGSTPIRVANGTKTADIVALIRAASGLSFDNMTAYVIPGEATTSGGKALFSVHKTELVTLLGEAFNPYGKAIEEANLGVTELASGKKSDMKKTVLSAWVLTQSGDATPETTTTTKK